MNKDSRKFDFLGRFRRNLPIALTLMVLLPENVIIDSPIMAPRPQNHPPFKIYMYILYMLGVCIAISWVRCRPQRSTDCNKIWHKI